jgi:hypothetical protein
LATRSLASAAAPASTAASAPSLTQAMGPFLQATTSLASPVQQGVSAVTSAVQTGAGAARGNDAPPSAGFKAGMPRPLLSVKPELGGGAGGGPGGGSAGSSAPSRLTPHLTVANPDAATEVVAGRSAVPVSGGAGGAPMMGGGPAGLGARAGASSSHSAAAFLHTSEQGGQIVGDLGNVAPPVIGEIDVHDRPDIDLRI